MLELLALSIAPIAVGVISQTYFDRTGILWIGLSAFTALYLIDALMSGALRPAMSEKNLLLSAKSALQILQQNAAPAWQRLLFLFGWSAVASLVVLAAVATLPSGRKSHASNRGKTHVRRA